MSWIKIVLLIPYYATLLVAFVAWLGVFCPLAFLTHCSITNRTTQTLTMTPVGTVGRDGHRCLLPLYRTSFPFFIKSKRGAFVIQPGEMFHFCYDMDDINFSEIVVRNENGEVAQIVVNANPTTHQYVVPENTAFIVNEFEALSPVPAKVRTAAGYGQEIGYMWLVYTVFAMLLGVEGWRIYKPNRPKQATAD